MNLEAYKGQYVKLFLADSEEPRERGIVIDSNDECVLLVAMPDYAADGYVIVPTKKRTEVVRGENEEFTESVLALKGTKIPANSPIPFGKLADMLKHFSDIRELVMFYPQNSDTISLGRVMMVDETMVVINSLDSLGVWDGNESFALDELTKINFATEYNESLKLWVKHKGIM